MPAAHSPHEKPTPGVDAWLDSLRQQADGDPAQRRALIDQAMQWLTGDASPEQRDAVLRALLSAYVTPASQPSGSAAGPAAGSAAGHHDPSARGLSSDRGIVRSDDLLHDTWSQLGGESDNVDTERLAGVARAACFAFLMDIDEFAANIYGQLNLDQALLDGSLRQRIAEYLNKDGEVDPEELLRLIQRRRTAVVCLMHLAGTAGWMFWQEIVRDQLSPERLESDAVVGKPGKAGKSIRCEEVWAAFRDRFEGLNQKEQLEPLWMGAARNHLARLLGVKDTVGV
jgi:hypothetical protein